MSQTIKLIFLSGFSLGAGTIIFFTDLIYQRRQTIAPFAMIILAAVSFWLGMR